MKKIYTSIFAVVASISAFAQTVPTCSLNTTFIASNKVGVFPDSTVNLASGVVGQPYVENLTIKVPQDTITTGVRFCFNKFVITTPTGVTNYNFPPGLNLGSSTTSILNGTVNGAVSLLLPGNANNCASIYGTPTVAGSYTLDLQVQPYMNGPVTFISPCSNNPASGSTSIAGPQRLKYYIINITAPTGVQEIGKDKMALYQNVPNPFSSSTEIKFYVEGEDNATITVYNALGSVVSQQTVKTTLGENKVTINASDLASGTYIYSLKYKNAITTKRMMVINN